MDVNDLKALVEFGNLEFLIKGAVCAANGMTDGLERDIDELKQALVAERFCYLDVCLAAIKIRVRCKLDQYWMPVRKALANYIHKSCSTLDNRMRAADKAQELGNFVLAALIGEGIDPTEQKYDSLLDDLPAAFSGTAGEAREIVRQALAKFREARKKTSEKNRLAKIKYEHDSPARTRRLLKDRLRGVPSSKRNDAGRTLFHDVVTAFAAEFSVSFLQHLLSEAQDEISRRQNVVSTASTRTRPQ